MTTLRGAIRFAPAFLAMAAIWVLSDRALPFAPPAGSDKLLHAAAYAGVGALTRWGFGRTPDRGAALWWSWAAVAAYGGIDEIHQAFVPGRTPAVGDWVADAVGAWIGVRAAGAALRGRPANGRGT